MYNLAIPILPWIGCLTVLRKSRFRRNRRILNQAHLTLSSLALDVGLEGHLRRIHRKGRLWDWSRRPFRFLPRQKYLLHRLQNSPLHRNDLLRRQKRIASHSTKTALRPSPTSIIASCPKKRLYSSFAILNAKTPWPWKRNLLQMVSKWLRTWASPSKATKNFLISLRDLYVRMKLQITFRLGVEKQFSRNLSRTTI